MIQENATFTNPNPNQAAFLDQLQSKHLEKQTLLTLSEVLERRNHRRVTAEQPATSNALLSEVATHADRSKLTFERDITKPPRLHCPLFRSNRTCTNLTSN